ncbi:hypothetical protein ACWDFH_32960 [Streptomyces kronopolitis]|uniref:hypothetical protein n=1 Tax=Streptomyces kronopolitis TaxID=1612435 RepID=UPI0036960821
MRLIWHPVYTGPDGRTREISRDCRLVDNAEYDGRDTCVGTLIQYLRLFHDESNTKAAHAHKSMEQLLAANGHKDGV